MPCLDKPAVDVLQGFEYDEIQALILAMVLKIANLTVHPEGR